MAISFGIVPSHGADRIVRFHRPFADELSKRLGAEVDVSLHESFLAIADELRTGKLNFGWLSPLAYARLADPRRLRLLLRSVRVGGGAYYCALFVRDGSKIQAPSDLAGKKVAWVSRDSVSGFVLPSQALEKTGIKLGEESFVGTHAAVVRAVVRGFAEAGGTFCTLDESQSRIVSAGWTETIDVGAEKFRVLQRYGPIPSDVVCGSPAVDPALADRLVAALVGITSSRDGLEAVEGLFGAHGFAADVSAEEYLKLRVTLG